MPPDSDACHVAALACPGVFYPTQSGDGVLSRIRTPGGLLTAAQCTLVADIADQFAGGIVTITNRANLQLRALADRLPSDVLFHLQQAGLAGVEPSVDHLRNIMASPAAGLDPDAVVDTRPLVCALDRHISTHPQLAALPAKFSVGLDGGERASIAGLPNDILFRAFRDPSGEARCQVVVRVGMGEGVWDDLGFALTPDQVVPVAAAIAEAYRSLLPSDGSKPRLRHLLAGRDPRTLQRAILMPRHVDDDDVISVIPTPSAEESPAEIPRLHSQARSTRDDRGELTSRQLQRDMGQERVPSLAVGGETPATAASAGVAAPVGVHAQAGDDLTYVGLVPFVAGRLSSAQVRQLAALAEQYGSGGLRLTPWRNVLLPDVPGASVEALQAALEAAGLPCRAPSLASGIVACAGRAGCASGATDTVHDAQALSARLSSRAAASGLLNIHLTGCEKCCAQRRPADITLLGRAGAGGRYDLFVRGAGDARLGHLLVAALTPDEALATVERLADSLPG